MRVTVRGHASLNTETPPALSTSTDPQVQIQGSKVPFFPEVSNPVSCQYKGSYLSDKKSDFSHFKVLMRKIGSYR